MATDARFAVPAVLICVVASACGGGSSSPSAPSRQPTVVAITVLGNLSMASAGQTSQLTASASFSNGTSQVVVAQVTWESSDPTVASVSATGLCTAVTFGQAEVRARYQGLVGTAQVHVRASMAGSWRGAWQSDWLSGSLTAFFIQTGDAVAGTMTISDAICFMQPLQVTGSVSGGTLRLSGTPNGSAILTITGTVDSTGNVFTGTDAVTAGGNCSAADGTLALHRQ